MPTDVLVPKIGRKDKWSVIACDQFTSEPQYWAEVERKVGNNESSLNLILPEVNIRSINVEDITRIHNNMQQYLNNDIFTEYNNSYIYVERTLQNGKIRPGIVGAIDLEEYSYLPEKKSSIRPTEKTVIERIPPRKMVRENASLELSHIILFYNDEKNRLVTYLQNNKENFVKIYGFDLMLGGGHIDGWLLQGEAVREVQSLFLQYQLSVDNQLNINETNQMVLAVGDGNHSLATAKSCWENLKENLPKEEWENHPCRFAMVEIENIHDESQQFEPIHRLVTGTSISGLLDYLTSTFNCSNGYPIEWKSKDSSGYIYVDISNGELPLAILQKELDAWIESNNGEIDYIHGKQTLLDLSNQENAIGFLLPEIDKDNFFKDISSNGVLPRKTFSIGHASEKRYYLEARKLNN